MLSDKSTYTTIQFEHLEVPGVETVDGVAQVGPSVWTPYFRDPDGNLLLLTQID